MSLTPLTFTGLSSFSEDFQTILNRSLSIASIPVQMLQNQQTDLLSRKLELSGLSNSVAALAARMADLGVLGEQKALVAASSDTAKVTAQNTGAASAATYTISEISSIAAVASESSVSGYATADETPVSATGTVKLYYGTNSYTIDLTGEGANNLTRLRDEINNLAIGVTATVLTTGTGENPYYLSVTANTTGATTLELRDDPAGANTNLLTTDNQGANTEFKLNGVFISKTGTLINDVVPGLTFTVLGVTGPGESVTLSLATSRSAIASKLQDFAAAYNDLVEAVNKQVGPSAGLLSGDFLVREVQDSMRSIVSYRGSGGIGGLADLGLEFDREGKITFDQEAFDALPDASILDAVSFLGSTTSGFGGLASRLTAISDPATGLAKLQQDRYDATERRLTEQITAMTERITAQQATLAARLQAADALLGRLESQQRVLDASLQGLELVLFGKKSA